MSLRKNIILTGFMACGKTTVGRLLAEKLERTFIDTDRFIEKEAEMSVAEIFALKGEEVFRELERKTAALLGQQQDLVIATGGRMMLDTANVVSLQQGGVVICLAATPEEIFRRVQADDGHLRPLLAVAEPEEKIRKLLKERKRGYARFPTVMTDGKSPEDIAGEVLTVVEKLSASPR